MTEKQTAPAGLAARGRTFWRETVESFDLTPAELTILTETCRTLDNLDALAASIGRDGAMVLGSKRQQVINPALTEARGQRAILHRLIAALALPDLDNDVLPSVQTIRARKAAAARWAGHRKDGRHAANGTGA